MFIDYYKEEQLTKAQAQRKKVLTIFFITLAVYLAITIGLLVWFTTLIYQSSTIKLVKFLLHLTNVIYGVFAFIFLRVKFRMVNKYYKALLGIKIGIKETYEGTFIEYDETVQNERGVEYKSLVFEEWNKFKKANYKRKVLIFNDMPFPEIEEGSYVVFVTKSNILVKYEIIKQGETKWRQ